MDFLNFKVGPKNNLPSNFGSRTNFSRCFSTQTNIEMTPSANSDTIKVNYPIFNLLSDYKGTYQNSKESLDQGMKVISNPITSMSVSYIVGSFIGGETSPVATTNSQFSSLLDAVMGKNCENFQMVTENILTSYSNAARHCFKCEPPASVHETKIEEPVCTKRRTYAEVTKQNLKTNIPQIVHSNLNKTENNQEELNMESSCAQLLGSFPTVGCVLKIADCSFRTHNDSISSDSSVGTQSSDPVNKKTRSPSDCSLESDDSFVEFVYDGIEEDCPTDSEVESEDDEEIVFKETEQVDAAVEPSPSFVFLAPALSASELESANKKWNDFYPKPPVEDEKDHKVSFSNELKVHRLYVWDYASRAARIGHWEVLARDSARFRHRIHEVGQVISKIFDPTHRNRIYQERFLERAKSPPHQSPLHSTINI